MKSFHICFLFILIFAGLPLPAQDDQDFNADSATDFSHYDLRLDMPTALGTF